VKYASTFWGVVNQTGSVGAGASGAALFDPNNRLVGMRGREASGKSMTPELQPAPLENCEFAGSSDPGVCLRSP